MNTPSIRRSLLIRCGVGIGVLLLLMFSGVYFLVRGSLLRELDGSIRDTAAILANQVELEDEEITYEWQEGIGTNNELIEGAMFQFWNETDGSTTRSQTLGDSNLPKFTGEDGSPRLSKIRLPRGQRGHAVGLVVYPFVLPQEVEAMEERGRVIDPSSLPHTLVVARDAEPVYRTLRYLRLVLISGGLLTLGIGFYLIAKAVRTSLEPIDRLATQVQERSGHQLDEALVLPAKFPAELRGLADNFDLLLSRVAATRQRERDFIRHAAHELRTPIAGLRATTDLALSQKRDAEAYAQHLATCQTTAVELGELVKRLSALARIGQTKIPASQERIDLVVMISGVLKGFAAAAAKRDLKIVNELGSVSLFAKGDVTLLRIILSNLLDNAVNYATEAGHIRIHGRATEYQVLISIANSTPSFPEDPDRLFEPLFRRDTSRTDAESHLGIGLTLSQEAARAMGGVIRAGRSEGSEDLEFTLVLPGSKA